MESSNINSIETQQTQEIVALEKGTCTFLKTCFNGINALSGVGILSISYALSQSGWLSLTLLLMVASLCCYTGLLLQRCVVSNSHAKSYPDIGELAFGAKGRAFVSVFLYLELYLVAVEFIILEGDNLAKLFPNGIGGFIGMKIGSRESFMILTSLIILPTTWLRSLGMLAYVSAGGVFASLIVVVSVFWTGAFDGVGFHEKGILWSFNGLPNTISLFTFCYCGHAVFPTLCISMKDRSQFKEVLLICFVISTFSYATMAIIGYLMYGQHLDSQITLNLPVNKISSQIAIYTTLINPLTKYALVITPIATCIEDRLRFLTSNEWVLTVIIRTMLVMSTVIVAITVPFFGYVMEFTGAFLSVTVSVLLPCLCYLKLGGFRKCKFETSVILVIIVLGLLVGVMGTCISVRDIVINLLRS
ncbi:hypothetical protein V2J09_015378 [Rumex salicifolius]